ncbi:MAG: dihydrofolate reductase [Candidatus Zophobacter franzmannii]|nr:dihydrofolate reductase [Candidatus Zophobacter franzmannii]
MIDYCIIVAMDQNKLIGASNKMPWSIPLELSYFKKTTMGYPIVMGRRTYESVGKALPGRRNIVLSNTLVASSGIEVVNSIDDLHNLLHPENKAFIIGGREVFAKFLQIATHLYITEIGDCFEGDTYFPEYDVNEWELVSKDEDRSGRIMLTFKVFKRRCKVNSQYKED